MKSKTTVSIILALAATAAAFVCIFFRSVPIEAVYPVLRARLALRHFLRTDENVRLRREVAALAQALQDAERLEAENVRLRQALDYVPRPAGRWVAVEVLSRGGAAADKAHTIRVGKGACDDFEVGAVVVVPEGLVGRVTSVTPHTADITLITDPSVQVSCLIEAPITPRARGVLSGGTNERLDIRHLRHADGLPPRSRVVTSGLGGVFPKGIAVGTLMEDGVLPAVDFELLEDVFVRVVER